MPFAAWVVQQSAPRVFVELGTHTGNSYFAFCQAVQEASLPTRCFAVDTWLGDEHAGFYGDDIFAEVTAHNSQFYANFSTLMRTSFDEALHGFADASVDLLHIDGCHSYEAVRHDFEAWLPKLAPGALVLLHDSAVYEAGFGVWKLWKELQAEHPCSLEFPHSHGLGILQLHNGPQEKKLAWLQPGFPEQQVLKEYFAVLGANLLERFQSSEEANPVANALQILAVREEVIKAQERALTEQNAILVAQNRHMAHLSGQLLTMANSRSWAVTRPLRFIVRLLRGESRAALGEHAYRLGKKLYWKLPESLRGPLVDLAYGLAGPLFAGRGNYERWRLRRQQPHLHEASAQLGMVDISTVPQLETAPEGSIAIQAHIYYADLIPEFVHHIGQMPYPFDLYLSVPDERTQRLCLAAFARIRTLGKLVVEVVPNRGRDIAPLLSHFGQRLLGYEYVAHVHTKKSLHNGGLTPGWREYLLAGLLGGPEQIRRIFALLCGPGAIGMVYPQTHSHIPYRAHTWLGSKETGRAWCTSLGIASPEGYFDFPAGSMFWARTEAIRPLLEAGLRLEDFQAEEGQTDGTLAHAMERLLGLVPGRQGYSLAVLRDTETPGWSRWRMESGLDRTLESLAEDFSESTLRVVAFDIFDTLLLRPLLNPEHTKRIVARRVGGDLGKRYLAGRHQVESAARDAEGQDVGLDAIYEQWASLGMPSARQREMLRAQEEETEVATVQARPEAVELFNKALAAGKRVVLASDMFLPKPVITRMLAVNNIMGWHQLYLSNDIGVRKDTGALYRHLLGKEGVAPDEALMVGDNEQSDVQIPAGLGMRISHILRPIDVACSQPRWNALIEKHRHTDDLDASVGLGLILRRHFAGVHHPGLDGRQFLSSARDIGYAVAGPLCFSFCAWLKQKATVDGVETLYFLSREGAILKRVYDRLLQANPQGPASDYLVVSRRAVSVPAIRCLDDIFTLAAQAEYFENTLGLFLYERYGLVLDEAQWAEIFRSGLWARGQTLVVQGGGIEQLKPLLRHLQPVIMEQASQEAQALLRYLKAKDLPKPGLCAVVDAGYSGTVQQGLIRMLKTRVDGYYMMANEAAKSMGRSNTAAVTGCFLDGTHPCKQPLKLHNDSFMLEKMLSSNDEQVLHYRGGLTAAEPFFREQAADMARSRETRQELQDGLMAFIEDALDIRENVLPDFVVPADLACSLFEAFMENMSETEQAIMNDILLDDYYCGRGLA